MPFLEVFFIAAGLAMDCFAVAVSRGMAQEEKIDLRRILVMACLFGGFQSAMTLAGWGAGVSLRTVISGFDHWIAFFLLGVIGAKMIIEAFREKDPGRDAGLSIVVLIGLAFATSIDALAVGLSFAFLGVRIFMPAAVIGAVSLLVTLAGANLGRRIGNRFGSKAEVAGGLILIGIGVKILFEHLR